MNERSRWVLIAVAVVEVILVALGASARIPLHWVLIGHGLAIVPIAIATWRLRGHDAAGRMFMAMISTAVAGPFGALGALALPLLSSAGRENSKLLEDWYERISNSTATDALTLRSDHVAIGRSADLGAPVPPHFDQLFLGKDISAQQTALGLIARKFHPDYIPTLRAALNSQEPIVRVQAAAVTARVRDKIARHLSDGVAKACDPATSPSDAIVLIDEVNMCADSGLIGATDAARARAEAEAAISMVMQRLDARRRVGEPLRLAGKSHAEYERYLIATGQFDVLRDLRRRRRSPVVGRLRRRAITNLPAFQSERLRRGGKQ